MLCSSHLVVYVYEIVYCPVFLSFSSISPVIGHQNHLLRNDVNWVGRAQYWVTTFLEFLETWICQGIRLSSGKRWEKGPKSGKVREFV